MSERQRRIGENEAIFRSFNEQVRSISSTFTVPAETLTVVCECGNRRCSEQFAIAPDEYGRVRDDPTTFVIKPGHDLPEAETVVAKTPVYWVVQKHAGLPADVARETDPS
jgi:hypothetical protein